jgi:hypothetical protein
MGLVLLVIILVLLFGGGGGTTPMERTAEPASAAFSDWSWSFSSLYGLFVAFDHLHLKKRPDSSVDEPAVICPSARSGYSVQRSSAG